MPCCAGSPRPVGPTGESADAPCWMPARSLSPAFLVASSLRAGLRLRLGPRWVGLRGIYQHRMETQGRRPRPGVGSRVPGLAGAWLTLSSCRMAENKTLAARELFGAVSAEGSSLRP